MLNKYFSFLTEPKIRFPPKIIGFYTIFDFREIVNFKFVSYLVYELHYTDSQADRQTLYKHYWGFVLPTFVQNPKKSTNIPILKKWL